MKDIYQIPLYPFILEDVAGEKDLNLGDGIHPNIKGHQTIARNLYPHILKFLGLPAQTAPSGPQSSGAKP